ncbi:MAG: hypothetical protein KBC06_01940 [Candidatus Pacebacteria bacterium]|nr:hypothetical protein [Candidatus Paceibacterota bacterium]
MNNILNSQVFFFISSIGFIILWGLMAVFLFYVIKSAYSFSRIMDKIERGIDTVGDATLEMLEDARDSFLAKMFFGKKKKSSRKK